MPTQRPNKMNRRQFLLAAGAVSSAFITTGAIATWLDSGIDKSRLTIAAVLAKLDQFNAAEITVEGRWNWSQLLQHCAQSVEFSIQGYPEHSSALFKQSVGQAAFYTFSKRGQLSHDVNEPIPGAPKLIEGLEPYQSRERFRRALLQFQHHQGELAEHFAFGKLTKQEYEMLHAMHFYQHLEYVSVWDWHFDCF